MPKVDDITNRVLGRFLSAEVLTLLIVGGMAWGSLTTEVDALDGEVSEVHQDQKEAREDVNEINSRLDVIQTNQEHFYMTEHNELTIKQLEGGVFKSPKTLP